MWKVLVKGAGWSGGVVDVEAGTVAGAVHKGLEELGLSDNDEAMYTIEVSGEAD